MNYNAALYIRLSKEDENKNNTNSESVENQKNILTEYANKNDYKIYDYYIDDGYTGTNFNRPSFLRLIDDINNKKIDLIIVKDLSRFGRDYIITGYYLEMFFPSKNIRFISILDNYDSINNINEYMPFKAIINDMFSKDNSKKIKAALRIKQQMGKWVGGCTPFGYSKDVNDKNHLVVNYEEAIIVRKIYSLFLSGYSINKIKEYLFNNKVKTPTLIRNNKKNSKYSKEGYWSSTTIKTILKNELYTGNLVQNRRCRINYKIRKLKNNNRDEWIIVNNTHDVIIDKEDFDRVQKIFKEKNVIKKNNKNNYLLTGFITCFECKKRMSFQKNKNNVYLICNTYKKYSKQRLCSSHSNNYKKIEKIIINKIKILMNHYNLNVEINRKLLLLLIKKIEVHSDKTIDVYFNFKNPCLSL